MAEKSKRHEENVPGKFYVDHNCIASKFCVAAAPEHFKMAESGDHAYVVRQPKNEGEHARCREALEGCPVDAVGEDG